MRTKQKYHLASAGGYQARGDENIASRDRRVTQSTKALSCGVKLNWKLAIYWKKTCVDGRSDTVLRARRQLMLEQHNTNIVLNPTGIYNNAICNEKSYDRRQ